MVVGILIASILTWYECRVQERIVPRALVLPGISLFAFLGSITVATFLNTSFYEALLRISPVISIVLITGMFSVVGQRTTNIFLYLTGFVVLASSLLGIIQFFFLGDAAAPATYLSGAPRTFYATGFANFSSLFGASLTLFIPLFWGLALNKQDNRRPLWTAIFLVSISALIVSFSRSALIGCGIGVAIVLIDAWISGIERRFLICSGIAAIVICAITVLYVPPVSFRSPDLPKEATVLSLLDDRFNFVSEVTTVMSSSSDGEGNSKTLAAIKDYSAYSRYAFHQAAFSMIFHSSYRFFFGYGLTGFADNWLAFKPGDSTLSALRPDPHSAFLEVLVSTGVFGFFFFALFLYRLLYELFRIRFQETLAIPCIAALSGILIDGLFHTHFYSKYVWIFVGLGISIVWNRYMSEKEIVIH